MFKTAKRNNGSSLITVIVLLGALTILSAILMDMVLQSLVMSKRHKNVDFTYYAGESAIEKWFSEIENKIEGDPNIGDGYANIHGPVNVNGTDDGTGTVAGTMSHYAQWLIGTYLSTLSEQYIDIAAVGSSAASTSYAHVELFDLSVGDVKKKSDNEITITFDITAKADFSPASTNYNAGNKKVFAKRDFDVYVPVASKGMLAGAIYSVRDFFVDGADQVANTPADPNVKVKGDVYVFGSYSNNIKNPQQYFYGGIYALRRARLDIDGNAYSRSFIRTGRYPIPGGSLLRTYNDSSEIRVYKDAIAQCLQIFGGNDRIVVYRNAYTFDDLEVNGQNSVIAINGSYFGLSRGGNHDSHDESSAIVNSAPVHHPFIDTFEDSKKSRIVINGDVVIAGGTFKIDEDGNRTGQMEDASVAWYNDNPYYKDFNEWDVDDNKYHSDLRKQSGITAFLNIFQRWDVKSVADIDSWLQQIEYERDGDNSTSYSFEKKPIKLTGYWNFEVAANDRLYEEKFGYDEDGDGRDDFDYTQWTTVAHVKAPDYRIDNIFYPESDPTNKNLLRFNESYWTSLNAGAYLDYKYMFKEPLPGTGGTPKLAELRDELEKHVEVFAGRDYYSPSDPDPLKWDVKDNTTVFNKMLDDLSGFTATWESVATSAPYVVDIKKDQVFVDAVGNPTDSIDIREAYQQDKASTLNIYNASTSSRAAGSFDDDNEYFLIVNRKPSLTLEVSGTFNGIILTTGKVVLKDGANIYGSIIAGGGGRIDIDPVTGKDVYVPELANIQIDSTSEVTGSLDTGNYAGVKFVAAGAGDQAFVDFYLGLSTDADDAPADVISKAVAKSFMIPDSDPNHRDHYLNWAARWNLLDKFKKHDIYLDKIF